MKRIFRKILSCLGCGNDNGQNARLFNKNTIIGLGCCIESSANLGNNESGTLVLEGNNYIGKNVDIDTLSQIFIGKFSSIQDRCKIIGDVEIGRFCLFAPNVFVSSGKHYYALTPEYYIKDQDSIVRNSIELSAKHSKKVTIEDDCWIGVNAVIMDGVTIGKGSVIGANSVVTKDVYPYSIMAGSPAKKVKERLKFEAKDLLVYSQDEDMPYFYSGCLVDLESLKESRGKGGIRVMPVFTLFLRAEGKNKIILQIKNEVQTLIRIEYNNQTKELSKSTSLEVSFDILPSTTHHKFHIVSDLSVNNIFLQSARTI